MKLSVGPLPLVVVAPLPRLPLNCCPQTRTLLLRRLHTRKMKMPRRTLASLVLGAGALANAATTRSQARNDHRILLDAVKVLRATTYRAESCSIFTPTSLCTEEQLRLNFWVCIGLYASATRPT